MGLDCGSYSVILGPALGGTCKFGDANSQGLPQTYERTWKSVFSSCEGNSTCQV